MLKNTVLLSFLLASIPAVAAPAVGVFASIPAYQTSSVKSLGLERLIFTAEKLTAPATFSYFDDRGRNYLVGCCVDVKDLTPVSPEALIQKYPGSDGFASAIRGIKGYRFIYRAVYSASHATHLLKTGALTDKDGGMLRIYPAAEISIDADHAKAPFGDGASSIDLKSDVSKGKEPLEIYTFTVNGQKSVFSFPASYPD